MKFLVAPVGFYTMKDRACLSNSDGGIYERQQRKACRSRCLALSGRPRNSGTGCQSSASQKHEEEVQVPLNPVCGSKSSERTQTISKRISG